MFTLRRLALQDISTRQRPAVDSATLARTANLLAEVRANGDAALIALAQRFGDLPESHDPARPILIQPPALHAALVSLPAADRAVLERTADRVSTFARAQRACLTPLRVSVPGGFAGHDLLPVDSAGCYAPGGRYPLPSSVLMTALTARAAGVARVIVASPKPSPVTLAAAAIAGADALLPLGGVQAIAALAHGGLGLAPCDIIVGPGNRWVTAAKQLVSAHTGIDMLAGPSELVILADDSADPALIAADLLAQAEHDDDARAILVTTSTALIAAVEQELDQQLTTLPTAPTARTSLGTNGGVLLVPSLAEAVDACNTLAPEHLQVMTRDAATAAQGLRHAGGLFIGSRSAEVLGDYGVGPNHVLPTGSTARFRAGLSVFTFLRARTFLEITKPAPDLARDAAALGRLEGLEAHARAADRRV